MADYEKQVPGGKARRQRKKKKAPVGCMVVLVLLAAAVIAGIAAAVQVSADYKGREGGEAVEFTVEQGSSWNGLASKLKAAGIIRYPTVFKLYLRQAENLPDLQYGTFTLTKGEGYDALVRDLNQIAAKADTVRVTFPDGNTAIDFANRMEEAGLCTAQEFLDVANNGDFSQFRFWNERNTDENCFMPCEGYLYPETYDFYVEDTVYHYVETFYAHFDAAVTDDLYDRMKERGTDLTRTVILASFVQEEAGNAENAHVSAVFNNRLAEGSPFPALESNACSYIQNDADNNYLWNWVAPYYGGWDNIPQNIYKAYDTYQRPGLPAGAISNPGIDAIRAALYPEEPAADGPYYFFVTDFAGTYYYGKTVAQHGANCEKAWSVNASLKK